MAMRRHPQRKNQDGTISSGPETNLFCRYSILTSYEVECRAPESPVTAEARLAFLFFKWRRVPLPRNVSSIEQRRAAQRRTASDLRAYVFLTPVIACHFSILLALEFHAFECAMITMGLE